MKSKRLLFLILSGLTIPNLGSCSAPIFVDKIIVDGKDKIDIGETTTFKAEIYPTPKSETTVNWSVSDPNIAFIDSNGNLTGINKGKVTISANVGQTVSKQDIYIGGFIEHPVESISIGGVGSLNVGEYAKLDITFIPENATNKDVIWTSSNPKILSVNESGVVKGENYTINENKAVITATSKDGNKVASTTISVKENTDKLTIKSFSKPNCLIHYEQVIENSEDKIIEDNINRDNSKNYVNNKFYKYDASEKMKQIYKVGNDNPFKFKCNITTSNGDPFKEIHDNNPYQKFTLLVKTGEETYNDVTEQYKSNSYKGNEIQFNKTDAGKTFKLTVEPDPDKYIVDPSMNATLEFQVIDGYNAYDFAGLITVDNWTLSIAKTTIVEPEGKKVLENGEFVDLWSKYKEEHNIPNPAGGFNAVILHNNIQIEQNELPSSIVWTEKETDDFISGKKFEYSKDLFDYFVETKLSIHQDDWGNLSQNAVRAKCRNLIKGSRKDHTMIFSRQMNNNFVFEGNYFTIDESKVKPVCYFDDVSFALYYKITIHFSSLFSFGISNTQLYNKYDRSLNPLFDEFRPYGELQCRNSNEVFVSNLNIIGNAEKNGTHDEGIGGDCAFSTNCIDSTFINVTSSSCCRSFIHSGEAGVINTRMTLDRCKINDNFSEFMYLKSASNTQVKNCFMKDAASVGIRMYEEENAGNIRPSNLHLTNSYIECFVSGNEIYNKNIGYGSMIKILGSVGFNAFTKYNKIEYGKDGKFTPKIPRNFIKIEDDVIYVNLVLWHGFGNIFNLINPGKSTMDFNEKNIFNLEKDASDESPISKYNDFIHGTLGAISFKSTEGGHARLPLGKITEPDDLEMYDSNISLLSSHMMSLSEYVARKDEIDNDEYLGSIVPSNFGNLFSGEYLTCYLKPPAAYMSAIVLGYK